MSYPGLVSQRSAVKGGGMYQLAAAVVLPPPLPHTPTATAVPPYVLSALLRLLLRPAAPRLSRPARTAPAASTSSTTTTKTTQWEDPRPLPLGWEVKHGRSKLKRKYYIDHNTQTTHWEDPRPRVVVSQQRRRARGGAHRRGCQHGGESDRTARWQQQEGLIDAMGGLNIGDR